jgi:hypothetical protein
MSEPHRDDPDRPDLHRTRRRVNPTVAREVAAEYLGAPTLGRCPQLVRAAYARLVMESDRLFEQLTSPGRPDCVRITFTACPTPYASAHELITSVRAHRLLEVTTSPAVSDRRHPLMGCEPGGAYDRFRGVHDVLGHARLQLGFDRDGEFAVWRSQKRFHGRLARQALATELHGQHSVRWTTGQVAEPKAILLDPRRLRRSRVGVPDTGLSAPAGDRPGARDADRPGFTGGSGAQP